MSIIKAALVARRALVLGSGDGGKPAAESTVGRRRFCRLCDPGWDAVLFRTQRTPWLPMIVLHVIAVSTCYTYVSVLSCRRYSVALTDGAFGFGRRCRKCRHLI